MVWTISTKNREEEIRLFFFYFKLFLTMAKNNNWEVRGSLVYLIVLLLTLGGLIFPIIPGILMPIIGLLIYIRLKMTGHIKKFDFLEVALVIIYTIVTLVTMVVLEISAIYSVPWLPLIMFGIAADVIASVLSGVPIIGDILSGILVFTAGVFLIGGPFGFVIGLLLGIVSLFPGPTMGLNTFILIFLKLIFQAVGG